MVEFDVKTAADLDTPTLVEGLPGVGLVGKIAADFITEELGLTEYAELRSEDLPPVAVFEDGDRELKSPVRVFVDESCDLLVLQSAVPFNVLDERQFVKGVTAWIDEQDATPIYIAGIPTERDPGDTPEMYGIASGDGAALLDDAGVQPPTASGVVQGPGGVLLREAKKRDVDAVGLLVESDPRFPDPHGAQRVIDHGIEPLADIEVDTQRLTDEAEQIVEQREEMVRKLEQAEDGGTRVSTRGMFQ